MFKNTVTTALTLFTIFMYSQNITFQPNVNYNAHDLEQIHNEKENFLMLESKYNVIQQVAIFSDDFSDNFNVNSNNTTIDLNTLPDGDFVIQAKLDQKWIVMSLKKENDFKISSTEQKNEDLNDTLLASHGKTNVVTKEANPDYYWVVSESNSNFGSNKSMRLEYKNNIAKLISKIKLELKSEIGKNNKLLIYEIYNKSKFMTKQLRNPEYYKSEASNVFNVVPIYASIN